ncbi:hypothetical protein LCGC14_3002440 [marine sediment metagenome]|uniref:Uncharacterized protein n=1 Tax=marine sediment metagenome TaxID=412755 RepID=A0A0F8X136_9ZZZZ
MTDETREPTVEEQIAKGNPHKKWPVLPALAKVWNEGAQFVLDLAKIQEGQELLEKADRLVELYDPGIKVEAIGEFRRVKPLASGESR